MMRAAPRQSAGFTLVELLVAIMILTLFMTASMGAVRIASKSWAAGQQRADAVRAAVREESQGILVGVVQSPRSTAVLNSVAAEIEHSDRHAAR